MIEDPVQPGINYRQRMNPLLAIQNNRIESSNNFG